MWNEQGRFQGRSDVALDETGLAQARALGRALRGERFGFAVASVRAQTTAELVLAGRPDDVPLEIEPRWREFDFGAWEGLTWTEIVARFPEAEERPNAGGRFVAPTGGSESFDDLVGRVAEALSTLRAREVDRALVVTHAGPLHALLRLAYGSEGEALAQRFVPASINRFRIDADGIEVVRLNETA